MGFFDKILGGREEEDQRVVRVSYSELAGFLSEEKRRLASDEDEEVEELLSAVPKEIGSALERLKDLQEAKMGKDVPGRIKSIVSSSRDNYVKQLRRALLGLDAGKPPLDLANDLREVLGDIFETDKKYGERANYGFRKDLQSTKKELNKLVEISEELNNRLAGKKESLGLLRILEKNLRDANGRLDEIDGLENRKAEAAAEIESLRKEMSELEKRMSDLNNSEDARRAESVQRELEELGVKKKEIENFVLNVLGPLKRIFKKYAKAVEGGKASGINVDKYAKDPTGTYLWGEHTLPELLAKIQKGINTGVLDLDEGEAEKTVKKIRNISFSYLEKNRSEYNAICSRIRTLELAYKDLDVSDGILALEGEISSHKERITGKEEELENVSAMIEEEKMRFEEEKARIEKKLCDLVRGRCELI